jgi:hypothetical protein
LVDTAGNLVFSSDPSSQDPTWQLVPVDSADGLSSVFCRSSALCVAGGIGPGFVETSTMPMGPPGDWSRRDIGGEEGLFAETDGRVVSLSCPSASFCAGIYTWSDVAASTSYSSVISSRTPVAGPWNGVDVDTNLFTMQGNFLQSISCPTTTLCVAVDDVGQIVSSSRPSGGRWKAVRVDGRHLISAVSCPSRSFCVAVDDRGAVLISSRPGGGKSAWKSTPVDHRRRLTGVVCTSRSFCVAVDGRGNVITSRRPAGGVSQWHVLAADARRHLTEISCPSQSFCAAADPSGRVVVGTR